MRIFSVNFNKSINDIYGSIAVLGSSASIRNDEKGRALKCNSLSTDYITYGDIASINAIGTGEFSFVVGANIKGFLSHGGSGYNILSGKGDTSSTGIVVGVTSSSTLIAYISTSSISSNTIPILNKNNIYIITRNSLGLCNFYVNGISIGTPITQTTTISNINLMSIGYDGRAPSRTPNASIYLAEVYNHCLTNNEIQTLTANFLAQTAPSKPKRGFVTSKPTDLSMFKGTGANQGLVFASSMQPIGNTLVDISGNNNSMTLTGNNVVNTKEGVLFPNSGYYKKTGFTGLATGLNANQYTVSMRVKFNEVGRAQDLLDFVGGLIQKVLIASNRIVMQGVSNALTSTSVVIVNKWYTVNFLVKSPGAEIYINGVSDNSNTTYTENITTLNVILGHYSTELGNYKLNGEIADVRIHNRILTPTEIRAYHNSFSKPVIVEDFSDSPADETIIIPREWLKETAVGKIGELTVGVNTEITKGTKYFEFTTTGTMSIPVNLNEYVSNGYVSYWYYTGGDWVKRTGFVNAPVTGIAYSNGRLVVTGASIGDRFTNLVVKNQIIV